MAHLKRCNICGIDVINEFVCMDCFRAIAHVGEYDKEEIKRIVETLRDAKREQASEEMLTDAAKLHGQPGCPTHGNSWCTCGASPAITVESSVYYISDEDREWMEAPMGPVKTEKEEAEQDNANLPCKTDSVLTFRNLGTGKATEVPFKSKGPK